MAQEIFLAPNQSKSAEVSRETLQLKVAMQVMLTARRWKSWVAEKFRDAGHTGAPTLVLYYLVDQPKGLTLSELSSRMELSGASLTRLVQRLEKDGMVSRRRMVGDGRSWLIVMEPAGRAEMEAFEVHAAAMRQRVFEGVSEDDLAAALRVLDAVAAKLAAGPTRPPVPSPPPQRDQACPRRAQVGDDAGQAFGFARRAGVAAVQDQPVVRLGQPVLRHDLEQLGLDLVRRSGIGQAQPVRDAKDVGVHGDSRLDPQFVQHHRGRLSPHAGQGLKIGAVQRDLAPCCSSTIRLSAMTFLALPR